MILSRFNCCSRYPSLNGKSSWDHTTGILRESWIKPEFSARTYKALPEFGGISHQNHIPENVITGPSIWFPGIKNRNFLLSLFTQRVKTKTQQTFQRNESFYFNALKNIFLINILKEKKLYSRGDIHDWILKQGINEKISKTLCVKVLRRSTSKTYKTFLFLLYSVWSHSMEMLKFS